MRSPEAAANKKAYTIAYVVDRNRAVIAAARARPCADCGLVEPEIMELDHVPERGPKLFSVGAMSSSRMGIERLCAEIAKCDTVCPNDHKRRTVARRSVNASQ